MPIPSHAGPSVDGSENVYRAILTGSHWDLELDRPSSAAFDHDYFSAELCSRTFASETVARKRRQNKTVHFLVQFNCGEARELGFDTRDERDEVDPDNLAHVHVYNLWYDFEGMGNKQRKKKARSLSEKCTKIPFQ